MPVVAISPILLYIGMLIGAQAFQTTPKAHAPAIVLALTPHLAAWCQTLMDGALAVAGTSAVALGFDKLAGVGVLYPGLATMGGGAILTGLVLAGVGACIIDKNFIKASTIRCRRRRAHLLRLHAWLGGGYCGVADAGHCLRGRRGLLVFAEPLSSARASADGAEGGAGARGVRGAAQLAAFGSVASSGLSDTPASAKVAIPVWHASAARRTSSATAAPDASPSRMLRSTSGTKSQFIEQHAVSGFSRDMARERMGERIGPQLHQRRGRRGADEAVEQDWNALPPRRQCRAEDRRQLAAAESRGDRQRVVEQCGVTVECAIDDGALALKSRVVDAGAATGPARAAAAEQRRRDRRRRRGIADAHFAETDQIAFGRYGIVTGRKRGEEFLFRKRRLLGEVRGRCIERERNDAQLGTGRARQLIDRGAAGGEIRHHLRRHFGRIGRDAKSGHAVIAGKDQNIHAVQPRRRMALPMREPGDDIFETAEAARWLGQRGFALGNRRAGRRMPARQVEADSAQFGKGT